MSTTIVTVVGGGRRQGERVRGGRAAPRFLAVGSLAGASLLLGLAGPSALATVSHQAQAVGTGYGVGPVTEVSKGCPGYNAEVEEATAAPAYVYVAWIGCGGEGFARSTNGGRSFSKPITLPGSAHTFTDDPAVAVAPNGTVYVSFMTATAPMVVASFNHGASFTQASKLPTPFAGNWADRDFIAVGPNGDVYVTWDYGPTAAAIGFQCSPVGSCAYTAGDVNAVIQRSTDGGKTWSQVTPMQPGFPQSGGYSVPLVVQPNGRVDALVWGHRITNPITYTLLPGHEYFTSSANGTTWGRHQVELAPNVGSISLRTWWIDGDLATSPGGDLYATWDTQTPQGDIGWLSYSTDQGRAWSTPTRVTPDRHDNATHIVEVVGVAPGVADVAWQADNSPLGYATFLRPFSIAKGWLAPAIQVSSAYGNNRLWPGDTFGLAGLPQVSPSAPARVSLSWGSAIANNKSSEVYAAVVTLPSGDRPLGTAYFHAQARATSAPSARVSFGFRPPTA